MVEQKEAELVKEVSAKQHSFLNWKKKQKHLQLASDISPKEKEEKKEKEKKDKNPVIEFPKECIIPINHVIIHSLNSSLSN